MWTAAQLRAESEQDPALDAQPLAEPEAPQAAFDAAFDAAFTSPGASHADEDPLASLIDTATAEAQTPAFGTAVPRDISTPTGQPLAEPNPAQAAAWDAAAAEFELPAKTPPYGAAERAKLLSQTLSEESAPLPTPQTPAQPNPAQQDLAPQNLAQQHLAPQAHAGPHPTHTIEPDAEDALPLDLTAVELPLDEPLTPPLNPPGAAPISPPIAPAASPAPAPAHAHPAQAAENPFAAFAASPGFAPPAPAPAAPAAGFDQPAQTPHHGGAPSGASPFGMAPGFAAQAAPQFSAQPPSPFGAQTTPPAAPIEDDLDDLPVIAGVIEIDPVSEIPDAGPLPPSWPASAPQTAWPAAASQGAPPAPPAASAEDLDALWEAALGPNHKK